MSTETPVPAPQFNTARGYRPRFIGEAQNDFDRWPTLLDLFPHNGGGRPGMHYLLVALENSDEYIGKLDDPDGPADPTNTWNPVVGRQAPIRINDVSVMLVAKGRELETVNQGTMVCSMFVDERLPELVGLSAGERPEFHEDQLSGRTQPVAPAPSAPAKPTAAAPKAPAKGAA